MNVLESILKKYGENKILNEIEYSDLEIFSNSIYLKYCEKIKKGNYNTQVEWAIRHYLSSKKIALSTIFFTQTEYLEEKNMRNISYYTLYYSLFNACLSCITLLPYFSFEETIKVSHSKVFTHIENHFVNKKIFPEDLLKILNKLKLMRETYSYKLPLGGTSVFVVVPIQEVEDMLNKVLKIANLLSYLSAKAWEKKGKNIKEEYNKYQSDIDEMFFMAIEEKDYLGKELLMDSDDYRRLAYFTKGIPMPVEWFLENKIFEDIETEWDNNYEGYEITDATRFLSILRL